MSEIASICYNWFTPQQIWPRKHQQRCARSFLTPRETTWVGAPCGFATAGMHGCTGGKRNILGKLFFEISRSVFAFPFVQLLLVPVLLLSCFCACFLFLILQLSASFLFRFASLPSGVHWLFACAIASLFFCFSASTCLLLLLWCIFLALLLFCLTYLLSLCIFFAFSVDSWLWCVCSSFPRGVQWHLPKALRAILMGWRPDQSEDTSHRIGSPRFVSVKSQRSPPSW